MAQTKIVIVAFFLFALMGCSKQPLRVESLSGVDIKEIVCFEPTSGAIFWSHILQQQYNAPIPKKVDSCVYIGFGNFTNGEKAVILFEYNSSKNLLLGTIARNVSCECCKNIFLKGEILKKFIQFKGLSAESPFFLISYPPFYLNGTLYNSACQELAFDIWLEQKFFAWLLILKKLNLSPVVAGFHFHFQGRF